MESEIKALKDKLPKRGYSTLIMKHIPKKNGKPLADSDMIRQMFAGRSLSYAKKTIILKAVKEAVQELNAQDATLRKIIKSI